jgi:apolipoprotein N-acyltransferase
MSNVENLLGKYGSEGLGMGDRQKEKAFKGSDRWAYLWLGIVTLLLPIFYGYVKLIPLVTWVVPVLMVRFLRTQRVSWGLYVGALLHVATFSVVAVATSGYASLSTLPLLAAGGLAIFLPYVADRLLAHRLKGIASTLILPLTWVTVEYFRSLIPSAGSWDALANTQYNNLPLVQITSVTGLWGLSFLIAWLSPVVNYAWERGLAEPRVQHVLGVYAGILTLVLLLGGARLAFFPPLSDTVRVAAVVRIDSGRDSALEDLTREAAGAGAEVVAFYEVAFKITSDEQADFIAQAQELAQREDVYLLLALNVRSDVPDQPHENKTVFIAPSGEVVWEYVKQHLVGREAYAGYARGEEPAPVASTPYGNISSVICLDADSPSLMQEPGRDGADVMLVPGADGGIATIGIYTSPLITYMDVFRAVENGYALVRIAHHSLTVAVDHQGRHLAELNYFTSDEEIMYADVPTKGAWTIYSALGDWFAWVCVAGLVAIVVGMVIRRQKER